MYFKFKDFNMYYEKHGESKRNVLILPGWGNTRESFNFFINNLKNNNTVYIVDYPLFGNSKFVNRDLTIYDYAELIFKFIKQKKLNNLTIISHSFGCRIAIILSAVFNVNIEKLIIIDGAGVKPRKTLKAKLKIKIYKLLKKLVYILPNNLKRKYNDYIINIFASVDYKNLKENERRTFSNIVNEDLTKYLSFIRCETLIIWGNKDGDTPISDGYLMNKKIPNSSLIVLDNATHFSYLDYPYRVLSILKIYIEKNS